VGVIAPPGQPATCPQGVAHVTGFGGSSRTGAGRWGHAQNNLGIGSARRGRYHQAASHLGQALACHAGLIVVRKDPGGPVLGFTRSEWSALVAGIKTGPAPA